MTSRPCDVISRQVLAADGSGGDKAIPVCGRVWDSFAIVSGAETVCCDGLGAEPSCMTDQSQRAEQTSPVDVFVCTESRRDIAGGLTG